MITENDKDAIYAAREGRVIPLRQALKAGASPHLRDPESNLSMIYLALTGARSPHWRPSKAHQDCTKLLLEYGATMDDFFADCERMNLKWDLAPDLRDTETPYHTSPLMKYVRGKTSEPVAR